MPEQIISLPAYIGTKIIGALPMSRMAYIHPGVDPGEMEADEPGYFVRYEDGYRHWYPAAAFEKAFRPVTGMSFGQALEAMRAGKCVARTGWNGKGMYLWLLPAASVKAEWCREPHLKRVAEACGGEIEAECSVRMMTADKKVVTGWLASQTDMFADDWQIVNPEENGI